MAMKSTTFKNLNVRLSEQEMGLMEAIQSELEDEYGEEVRVTQRTVIAKALSYYKSHLADAEAERRKQNQSTRKD